MRIAILSYEYPPETGFGGIGTYSYYQARALAKLGHDVHVFAGSTRNGVFHSEHEGVKVTRIQRGGFLERLLGDARKHRAWWFQNRVTTGFRAYEALRQELERSDFDFIEAPECGGDAMVAATLLPVPVAVRFHSPARLIMGVYDVSRLDRELTAFAEQVGINQASVLTSCSQFLADEVVTKMGVRQPVHVLANGIDVPMFDRDDGIDVQQRFSLPKDKITVFFANRLEERKGIHIVRDMVFHCLQKYPNVAFAFAGRDLFGYMEKKILPFIRDHQLQSRFFYLGQLDLPAVRAVLKHSDIFLIPSLWENCPYSCIEAMTAGKAIVSSDCGGMPELIDDHRTGVLARNGDPASFIQALEEMIEDQTLRQRCGAAARAEVEKRLTDVAIAARTVQIYQGHRDGNPVRAESPLEVRQRVAEQRQHGVSEAEVVELRLRVAKLSAEVADLQQQGERHQHELRGQREYRLGSYLLHDLKLATASRRLKKWYRKARNLKNRARLKSGHGGKPRLVLSSTWDFPNPNHAFVYQEMQSLLQLGFDARVFAGEARDASALAARFGALFRRVVPVETVWEIHQRDLAHLQATRKAPLDAFLAKVAASVGKQVPDLLREPVVLRACTFTRMVELFGPEYLHSWFCYEPSFHAMFAAQVLGIPRGLTCYTDHVLGDFPFKLVKLQLQTADLIVATSQRARGELLQIGGADCEARILLKPNGVDGGRFTAAVRPATGAFELVSVCRFEPKKGLLELLDAMALLRQRGSAPRLHLVGGEDAGQPDSRAYAARVRQRVQELGLGDRVVLHGALPAERFLPILQAAAAFVAPYVETASGDKDGIPTAVLEAMATGLPVIASRAGALDEAVAHEQQGLLVPMRDAAALAAAIERLRDDAGLRQRLGEAAAGRFAREFDARVVDAALHERVRALLAAGGR